MQRGLGGISLRLYIRVLFPPALQQTKAYLSTVKLLQNKDGKRKPHKIYMACWSSENATRAYLQSIKMGKRGKEPDVAEFISALAAGNNAQLMAVACSSVAVSTTLALVAAAHQTGGRVVCILHGLDTIHSSKNALGPYANSIEFVVGDAQNLLVNEYKGADFVLIDCNIDVHKGIFRAAQESTKHGGGVIVGYNALHKGSWSEFNTQFLPIGNGLLVTKTTAFPKVGDGDGDGNGDGVVQERKRSRWVVTVDKCTGEEHVFRITSSHHQRVIQA